MEFLGRRPLHLALIAVLVAALYASTLNYPFLFDDVPNITRAPIVNSLRAMVESKDELLRDGGKQVFYHHYRVRALPYISFSLNGMAAGGTDQPWKWRVVNVALHIIMCWLVYALAAALFKTPRMRGAWDEGRAQITALISALFYAVHPLMTETVIYVSGRVGQMAAVFYLGSVVAYLAWRSGGGRRMLVFSIALGLCAMYSKETAFTLPLMVALLEWVFFDGVVREKLKALFPHLCLLPVIPLTKIIVLTGGGGGGMSDAIGEGTRLLSALPRDVYLYTQFTVVARYVQLVFWPAGQNLAYGWPVVKSLWGSKPLLALGLHLGLIGLAVYMLKAGGRRRQLYVAALGIFGFYLALAVESSVFPITVLINEYRTYLPLGFLIPGVVTLGVMCSDWLAGRSALMWKAYVLFAAMAFAAFMGTTHIRGIAWETVTGMWRDSISKDPANPDPYHYLAHEYFKKGDYLAVASVIEQGRAKTKLDWGTELLLAQSYILSGRIAQALDLYLRLLQEYPGRYPILVDAASGLATAGRYMDSEPLYLQAIALDPGQAEPRAKLGYVYLMTGRQWLAVEMFRSALAIAPEDKLALWGLKETGDKR